MASQTLQTIRNGWAPEIKRLNDNLEKLEASLSGTDECVLDIYSLEETLQDKIQLLEGELSTIKADIADLKNHLTSVIKELDVIKIDRGAAPPPNLTPNLTCVISKCVTTTTPTRIRTPPAPVSGIQQRTRIV